MNFCPTLYIDILAISMQENEGEITSASLEKPYHIRWFFFKNIFTFTLMIKLQKRLEDKKV